MKVLLISCVLLLGSAFSSSAQTQKAIVYVYSPPANVVGNLHKTLLVDDRSVVEVKPRRYFILMLAPGKHTLHFKDKTWGGLEKDFAAGETYYLRIPWREGGWAPKPDGIVVETADTGTFAIKNLKPIDEESIKDKDVVRVKLD